MQFQEEIYTSAAELLEGGGGGNLGIVARTRAFPRELEAELGLHRTYTMLPGFASDDPSQHPPRYILVARGPGRRHICFTRIVFAGADHTGRTTPLAHHLLFDRGQMERSGVTRATLLASDASNFHDRWREAPAWIDPPRDFEPNSIEANFPMDTELVDSRCLAVALATAAETLLRFPRAQQPVLFVLPNGYGGIAARLFANAISLVPSSIQQEIGCVTHIVETGDSFDDAALLQTYPDTPFLKANRQRRDPRAPLLLDLTNPALLPSEPRGPYASMMFEALNGPKPRNAVVDIIDAFEKFDFSGDQAAHFRIAWQLRNDMRRAKNVADVDGLAQRLDEVRSFAPNSGPLAQWAGVMVNENIRQWAAPFCWEALSRVAIDSRWPPETCNLAAEVIAGETDAAVPCILRNIKPSTKPATALRSLLQQIIRGNPRLLPSSIEQVLSDESNAEYLLISEHLLAAAPPQEFEASLEWSRRLAVASQAVREALVPKIREMLSRSSNTAARMNQLKSLAIEKTYRQQFYIPILQERILQLGRKDGAKAWSVYATALIQAGLSDGTAARQVRWIASRPDCRALVTSQVAHDWVEFARIHGKEAEIIALLQELGICSSAPIATASLLEAVPNAILLEENSYSRKAPAGEPWQDDESPAWSPGRLSGRSPAVYPGAGFFSRALYFVIPAILIAINLLLVAASFLLPFTNRFPKNLVLKMCLGIPLLWIVLFTFVRLTVSNFYSPPARLFRIIAPFLLLGSIVAGGTLILHDPRLASIIKAYVGKLQNQESSEKGTPNK